MESCTKLTVYDCYRECFKLSCISSFLPNVLCTFSWFLQHPRDQKTKQKTGITRYYCQESHEKTEVIRKFELQVCDLDLFYNSSIEAMSVCKNRIFKLQSLQNIFSIASNFKKGCCCCLFALKSLRLFSLNYLQSAKLRCLIVFVYSTGIEILVCSVCSV